MTSIYIYVYVYIYIHIHIYIIIYYATIESLGMKDNFIEDESKEFYARSTLPELHDQSVAELCDFSGRHNVNSL